MKKIVFCLLAAMLVTACSDGKTDFKVDRPDLEDREKDKVKEEYERHNIKVTSKDGYFDVAISPNGREIIAGDKGVWIERQKIEIIERITSQNRHIDLDINAQDNWIAAGSRGIFYNGERIGNINLGNTDSKYAVSINDSNEWMAAGNAGVYKGKADGDKVELILTGIMYDKSDFMKVVLKNDGDWVVVSDKAMWTSKDSDDESSPRSNPARPFPAPNAAQ